MPSYDYQCPTCQATTTSIRSINDPATPPDCTNCKVVMVRIYTSPPVRFRGAGWGKNR